MSKDSAGTRLTCSLVNQASFPDNRMSLIKLVLSIRALSEVNRTLKTKKQIKAQRKSTQ